MRSERIRKEKENMAYLDWWSKLFIISMNGCLTIHVTNCIWIKITYSHFLTSLLSHILSSIFIISINKTNYL